MPRGANCFAAFTPCHGSTGCGAFHLRSPTGGAANGMPLNDIMPEVSFIPSTIPALVCTYSKLFNSPGFMLLFCCCACIPAIVVNNAMERINTCFMANYRLRIREVQFTGFQVHSGVMNSFQYINTYETIPVTSGRLF